MQLYQSVCRNTCFDNIIKTIKTNMYIITLYMSFAPQPQGWCDTGGNSTFGRMVGVFAGFFIGFPGFWIGFCLPNEIPGCPMLCCDRADIFTLDRHPTLQHPCGPARLSKSWRPGRRTKVDPFHPRWTGNPKKGRWNFDTTGMSIVCHPRGVPLLRWPFAGDITNTERTSDIRRRFHSSKVIKNIKIPNNH